MSAPNSPGDLSKVSESKSVQTPTNTPAACALAITLSMLRTLPLDHKAFDVAQESNSALIESAKGSSIRRAIRDLARDLIK